MVALENKTVPDARDLPMKEINFTFDEGIFFFCTEKYEEAIKCFEKILRLDPSSKIVLSYMGLIFQRLERRQEAIKCYEKALRC